MELIRPNGMIEQLGGVIDPPDAPYAYGPAKPGRPTVDALHLAARQDRRRQPRRMPDGLRGRLLDLGA
jgi:hypothetical protein